MKNIAVLVYDFSNDYNLSIVDGISHFFADKNDVNLIVSTVLLPDVQGDDGENQYWTSTEILKSPAIDAIIVVTNSFTNFISKKTLCELLKSFGDKPIISVASKLDLPNSYFTHTICDSAYEKVVAHLKNKHHIDKIAFFSGELENSDEAEERFLAYKHALEKNGIEYNPDFVLPGNFTPGTAREEFLRRYKSKEDVPFKAILCVNDFSAGGCILAFRELGIDCPKDIALVGFDNSIFSLQTFPTLSSINQNIEKGGEAAAEIAYKVVNNQKVNKETILHTSPVYRQSCGCVQCITDSSAYVDENEIEHDIDEKYQKVHFHFLQDRMDMLRSINMLLTKMNTKITLANIKELLETSTRIARISALYICYYNEPVQISEDTSFVLPDSAYLKVILNNKAETKYIYSDEGILFNPKETIIPPEYMENNPGIYNLLPIAMHDEIYGFIYCKTENPDNTLNSINLKILTNVIIHIYDYKRLYDKQEQLLAKNQKLSFQSKTDELTQILNRRGLMEYGQQLLDFTTFQKQKGIIFFCDLDGLKTINDTYGHKIGDLAIKTEAQVLKTVFRDSDLIGRLSGDEFGVIAPGLKPQFIPTIRQRMLSINEKLSKENNLPFTLSISMGPIEFSEENSDLQTLLTMADKQLYEEKKVKHAERDKRKKG